MEVREPSIDDCRRVIAEVARSAAEPTVEATTVLLESYRRMAQLIVDTTMKRSTRHALAQLPLWTSRGWLISRPIYAIDDPVLSSAIGAVLPVWQPGGELIQFRGLLHPLQIDELDVSSAITVEVQDAEQDEEATSLVQAAVALLREDLLRNDPATAAALRIEWDDFAEFEAAIANPIQVSVNLEGLSNPSLIEISAFADTRTRRILLNTPSMAGRADAGGRAVASLFDADRRRVAQAWLAAYDGAVSGREALELRLAEERAADEQRRSALEIEARLKSLQSGRVALDEVATRRNPPRRPAVKDVPTETVPGESSDGPPRRRKKLIALESLVVRDPAGNIVGRVPRQIPEPTTKPRKGPSKPLPAPGRNRPPIGASALRDYTDLQKESLGLDVVRLVLATDDEGIKDLRGQHGVGADAIDQLDRYYELKVYAGEEPDRVRLEESQIRRAMTTGDFFLVVVSGLEAPNIPKVRIITDPLSQLAPARGTSVTLTGVRSARSLVFELREEDPSA
jgi:hypothetical protein